MVGEFWLFGSIFLSHIILLTRVGPRRMSQNIHKENNHENIVNESINEFSYSKILDESEAITDYLENLTKEVISMRVECAITNIELVRKCDSIDFERKMKEAEEIYKTCCKSLNETTKEK